jgi:16S rRNA G966 N2-methylase RsmD
VLESKVENSRRLLTTIQPIDLVLADPPWVISKDAALVVPEVVKGLLAPGAVVVIGHASREDLVLAEDSGLVLDSRRAWGDSALSFLHRAE